MKIIDDEGRIFGIVNVIDLTVILFIISAITGFSWLVYTGELFKDHDPYKRNIVQKEIVISIVNPDTDFIDAVKKEILRTKNITIETKINKITLEKIKTAKRIMNVTIQIPAKKMDGEYFYYRDLYNPYKIKLNAQIPIKTQNIDLDGEIVDIIK